MKLGSMFSAKWLANLVVFSTGDLKQSFLTEAQFQTLNGDTWVLCDGRDVSGSDYNAITGNTVIPDTRGVFLRNKNNGRVDGNENPDGDVSLGTYQGDLVGTLSGIQALGGQAFFGGGGSPKGLATGGSYAGGVETRPRNVTVNTFIKIN